ncbi:MAG: phosphoribosylformylglycinamidine synthase subunit PurQ [Deltaproteobacteria bacterium]|nr:phosphoribosylformylglycinamidine synthase subunit PurQ [Deltaproteobacteria bacterium]
MTQVHSQHDAPQGKKVKALILTGYGLNCDYETDFSLKLAGAESHRVHINEMISGGASGVTVMLSDYHLLVFGGGFSWADDHGAGVLMATKLKNHLGEQIQQFIEDGKLVLGICNGFQALVNLGLVPGFDNAYHERRVALTYNDSGNFVDDWVNLKSNQDSPCVFTKGISSIELPVRHGEGKFYAEDETVNRLFENNQVALQYADKNGDPANGRWPLNPNGSLKDIAGICDPSGRLFGLMPHPEGFNHYTNHPNWTKKKEAIIRQGKVMESEEGDGIKIFRNAVEFLRTEVV